MNTQKDPLESHIPFLIKEVRWLISEINKKNILIKELQDQLTGIQKPPTRAGHLRVVHFE